MNQPKSNNNNQIQPTNPLISQKTQFTLPLGLSTPPKPGQAGRLTSSHNRPTLPVVKYVHTGPEEGVHLPLLNLSAQKRPLSRGGQEAPSLSVSPSFLYCPSGYSKHSLFWCFLNLCQRFPFILDSHIQCGVLPAPTALSIVTMGHLCFHSVDM